jgi:soluble lytic murein transglycosylase
MQVLPGTAGEVAARHGISLLPGLDDPGLNLEIAAAMIADLMTEFGGRVEVVAAAYSAGPTKARRWIRGDEGADVWLWTEAIPYDVVRSYAREVAVSAALYAAWLGEPPPEAHVTLRGGR